MECCRDITPIWIALPVNVKMLEDVRDVPVLEVCAVHRGHAHAPSQCSRMFSGKLGCLSRQPQCPVSSNAFTHTSGFPPIPPVDRTPSSACPSCHTIPPQTTQVALRFTSLPQGGFQAGLKVRCYCCDKVHKFTTRHFALCA
jgi:hypothetical protein